jgi:hypothetical protein
MQCSLNHHAGKMAFKALRNKCTRTAVLGDLYKLALHDATMVCFMA